ncbi:SDR family NAD(P)-dependent oxidoreductase [Massilia sp. TN1-12]|uniref:SDR family NAD(P)-dependent oxidoreductase n=1 Tax=Massilia paldalensis TaxID=3377675 RepID=UPI00384D99E3
MQLDLEQHVAIVTGAAGDIGRATVAALVEEGALVVAQDIRPAVQELACAQVACICVDGADEAGARTTVAKALEHFGRLDILVNNAGRTLNRPAVDTSLDDWNEVLAVNAGGAFLHAREALRHMLAQRSGAIVNVGSISGLVGMHGLSAYAASKGAIHQLTQVLAAEAGPSGVRVNAVAPGVVETGFLGEDREASRASLAGFGKAHLLGRVAQPQEIADVIVWLASRRASFVTGAIVTADGGYTAI